MVELSTLGGPIKIAYEGQPNTNAFDDDEQTRVASLAEVAMSGSYEDLIDRPAFSDAALSGEYDDLIGKPVLDFVPQAQKGAPSGVAPLDAAGLVPLVHLNVGGLQYQGTYNQTTNTPALLDGEGSVGHFYILSATGTVNTGNGDQDGVSGDWIIYAAGRWQVIPLSARVASVNGQMGLVALGAADVGAVATVNGKSGTAVTLNAADVGALPASYTPPANPATTWDQISGKPTIPAAYVPPALSYNNQLPNRVANTWYPAGAHNRIVCILTNYTISTPSSTLQMRKIGTTAPTFGVKAQAIDTVNNNQSLQATVPAGWEYQFVPGGTRTVTEWFEGTYS